MSEFICYFSILLLCILDVSGSILGPVAGRLVALRMLGQFLNTFSIPPTYFLKIAMLSTLIMKSMKRHQTDRETKAKDATSYSSYFLMFLTLYEYVSHIILYRCLMF